MVPIDRMSRLSIQEREDGDFLSKSVWEFVHAVEQDDDYLRAKLSIVRELENAIRTVISDETVRIVPFGSSCCGLGMRDSDLDLILWWPEVRKRRGRRLQDIGRKLKGRPCGLSIQSIIYVSAAVPILKMELFNHALGKCVKVDLNINEYKPVFKTVFLNAYTKCDPRFPALVLTLKKWASAQGILDGSKQMLNSLSLTLMVVAYLQNQETPRVLPNLQEMYPEKFGTPEARPSFEELTREEPVISVEKSQNSKSVGELLRGLFDFYGSLDFRWNIITVNKGFVEKNRRGHNPPWCGKKRELCIRDPFVKSQATAKHVEGSAFEEIVDAFHVADRLLKQGSALSCLGVEF